MDEKTCKLVICSTEKSLEFWQTGEAAIFVPVAADDIDELDYKQTTLVWDLSRKN